MFIKRLIFPVLFVLIGNAVTAQTAAHRKSAYAVIDPVYKTREENSPSFRPVNKEAWIYGYSELEAWRLQELIRRKDSAKLKVGYPGVFYQPCRAAQFRLVLNEPAKLDSVSFRAVGGGSLFINDEFAADISSDDLYKSIPVESSKQIRELRFDLETEGEPPALLIKSLPLSTASGNWQWKTKNEDWQPAYPFPVTPTGVPPHKYEYPEHALKPARKRGNLYDFGRELFGYIQVKSKNLPVVSAGESEREVLDTLNTVLEQSQEMVKTGEGLWVSKNPMAFRYLYVENAREISCHAIFYPAVYKGAFACSDPTLTRIWMNSAYTLHLCMHDFLIDGIKRDRLPWAGDLAMSLMANAFTFGDQEIVRRSLTALGRAGIRETNINGVLDYSLWWIIAQDYYQLYFDDKQHLVREWARIKEALEVLSSKCDQQGFLKTDGAWVFIDWVGQEKWTALQVLWWWAQQSGICLAEKVNDNQTAEILKRQSGFLKNNLYATAWDKKNKIWFGNPQNPEAVSKHANFLAVISGLSDSSFYEKISGLLKDEKVNPVGTPYMAGFENIALSRAGNTPAMINQVKNYWGGMLKQGATTFWEACNPDEKDGAQYSFYDRPYGKSLCHAWSSGPAAILPSEILGIKILEDGWKRFSLNPCLGPLKWVSSTIPTPYGNISVDIKEGRMVLDIPAGITAEWEGEKFTGPVRICRKRDISPE